MRNLILSQERFATIQRVLERHGPMSMRDLQRSHFIQKWELEQAHEHGLLDIWDTHSGLGRPSTLIEIAKNVNKSNPTKVLPPNRILPKGLSIRHQRFVLELAILTPKVQAYHIAGYRPKSERAARAAACRLAQKHHIRAALRYVQKTCSCFQHFPDDIASFGGTPWYYFISMIPSELSWGFKHSLAQARNLIEARRFTEHLIDPLTKGTMDRSFTEYDRLMAGFSHLLCGESPGTQSDIES